MMPQVLEFVDFKKSQKSRYLENQTFFYQKNTLITDQGLLYGKKTLLVLEVTFKR